MKVKKIEFTAKEWATRNDTCSKAEKFIYKVSAVLGEKTSQVWNKELLMDNIKNNGKNEAKINAKYFTVIIK